MITCAEAVRQLWEYLDGVVEVTDREAIEEHLSFCRRCCGELDFAEELRRFLARPDEPDLSAGETLLDLGCGAGIDTILAAQRTGPTGHVIALDFLPEMLERTKTAAAEAGLDTIEAVEGDIEAIPLADGSVDHVISNGVINLA